WYIRRLSTVVHPEAVLYFLGKRLVRCGRVERATEYLQMAAQSPLRGRPACILAEVELRRLGITPGPRRTSLFDPAVARALQQLNSALTRMRHSQFDAA